MWNFGSICNEWITYGLLAAVGAAWSLLGSLRNGQAVLYLFQKHILFWKYIHSLSH